MAGISRREVLKSFAVLTGGMSVSPHFLSGGNAYAAQAAAFWDEYYQGAMKIFTGLRDTQVEAIEREMRTAYERIQKGGTIYSQITAGHFPTDETALSRTGQPGVFAFLIREAKDNDYAKLKPEDMIITNVINLGNLAAMKRGIRVVGLTVNYYPFAKTPPGEGYQIEYEGKILKMEDACSVMLDSQTAWDNGLLHPKQHPEFAVMPGSGIAQATVYWMMAAELAGLKAGGGSKSSSGCARKYVDICIERAKRVGKDRQKFVDSGRVLGDLIIKGGKWYVTGNRALVSDALHVATGPMVTRTYSANAVKKGDIVLIGSFSSNNPDEIKVANECHAKGAYVVTISPFSLESDSSGPRLNKEADLAFDTYSPESWGVVAIKGLDRKICPTTGVMADLEMWLLMSSWTDVMAATGKFPWFWKGMFMKDGTEYNKINQPAFEARGW
jgi:uncharacterized phosphosugar-binding protein